jgi:dUTPase
MSDKKFAEFEKSYNDAVESIKRYQADEDVWKFAAYWAGDDGIQVIKPGTRIAQFFIQKREEFEVSLFSPDRKSRGGFGSTGV